MKFAVIHVDEGFIQCIGIFTDHLQAVGMAYKYASELVGEEGSVTPLFELDGETGLGLTARYSGTEADVYILENGEEKEE